MQFLKAEEQATQFYFVVLLDESKLQEDGSPDPAYVREYAWPKTPPVGVSKTDYIASMKREMQLLAEIELAALAPAIPLSGF